MPEEVSLKLNHAAISEAHRVAQPFRKALTQARIALNTASADVCRLHAECVKVWTEAYNAALKAAATLPTKP